METLTNLPPEAQEPRAETRQPETTSLQPEGQNEAEFLYMTDPEQRRLLAERMDEIVDQAAREKAGAIVFLDRSARPLAYLFRDLWQARHHDETMPPINFLQIGTRLNAFTREVVRERVYDKTNTSNLGDLYDKTVELSDEYTHANENLDIDEAAEAAKELHRANAALLDGLTDSEIAEIVGESELARVSAAYRQLKEATDAGQPIMVIDEYSHSGKSVALAARVIRAAFPNAQTQTISFARYGDQLFQAPSRMRGINYNPPWRLDKPLAGFVAGVDEGRSINGRPPLTTKKRDRLGENLARNKLKHNVALDKQALAQAIAKHGGEDNDEVAGWKQEIAFEELELSRVPDDGFLRLRNEMHAIATEYLKDMQPSEPIRD